MDNSLYRKAVQGAVILTVNKRLARHLKSRYDLLRRGEGLTAWAGAEILGLSAWLNEQLMSLHEGSTVLDRDQGGRVWETIVEDDLGKAGRHQLLQVPQTARRALQAHQLLIEYAAEFPIKAAATDDHRAFLRWRENWQELSARKQWRDGAESLWLVADGFEKAQLVPPSRLVLAGFDQLPPDLRQLCSVLRGRGCEVEEWQPAPRQNVQVCQVKVLDPIDEVRQCASWARQILEENPATEIGIVAPQLGTYQSLFESILSTELDPSAAFEGVETAASFNMSLGHRLDREGPVCAAMKLLQIRESLEMEEISWLLRSPYAGNSRQELSLRARLDVDLRKRGQVEWPLPRLVRTVRFFAKRFGHSDLQFGRALELFAKEARNDVNRLPGDWAEHFYSLLRNSGWPGDRGLSSREYQAVEAFCACLARMTSLDRVSSAVSRGVALGMLGRLVSRNEFQPESQAGTIQVLGLLESAGLSFDHLWVVGLHDLALPQPPAPNPFIPLAIQRRYDMPRADAERERLFAEQIAKRLFAAAPQICLSWPGQVDGLEQRPSPLLADIAIGKLTLPDSVDPVDLIWRARPQLEQIADEMAPPLNNKKKVGGGTGILKDQALCPFRAFGHYRLKAQRLETPEVGLDSLARGTLIHSVLELFWKEVRDHSALVSLADSERNDIISNCVQQSLVRFEKEKRCDLPPRQRQLEQQRLNGLSRQWLSLETRRAPFHVEGVEVNRQVTIGNLRIRTRIDRIDQLEDGRLAVLDYKTGRPDPAQWFDDRVTEPQLPVYCLDLPNHQIAAVLFAVVRGKRGEMGYRGLARDPDFWPGLSRRTCDALLVEKGWGSLDDVLDHWETALTALAGDFTDGVASVDPVSFEKACKYCDLALLCRICEVSDSGSLQEDCDD